MNVEVNGKFFMFIRKKGKGEIGFLGSDGFQTAHYVSFSESV